MGETIDLEAVNALIAGGTTPDVRLAFNYEGLEVTVDGSGTVYVEPADREP